MNKGTFGSVEQYKMLDFLTEKISLMDDKSKNHISLLIHNFNSIIKKSNLIENTSFKNYILNLIYNDFIKRIDEYVVNKYEVKITTYLKNYIYAKIKNSKQK